MAKDNTVAIGSRDWQIDKTPFRHTLAGSTVTIHKHLARPRFDKREWLSQSWESEGGYFSVASKRNNSKTEKAPWLRRLMRLSKKILEAELLKPGKNCRSRRWI